MVVYKGAWWSVTVPLGPAAWVRSFVQPLMNMIGATACAPMPGHSWWGAVEHSTVAKGQLPLSGSISRSYGEWPAWSVTGPYSLGVRSFVLFFVCNPSGLEPFLVLLVDASKQLSPPSQTLRLW